MATYENEINDLERQFSDYLPTILDKKLEIDRIDLSQYSPEYQQEVREEHHAKAKAEIDVIINRFETHVNELRDRMAKNHFADSTMLREKQRFAEEHKLTLSDAEAYLEKYVSTADLSEITNERSPHHKLFMATLAKSGRQGGEAYANLIENTRKALAASGTLNYISGKCAEIKRATLSHIPINSGDICVSMLNKQRHSK